MAVTENSGNGYALYNGVKLPNIDSVWTDKETYLYAHIQNCVVASGVYALILSVNSGTKPENGRAEIATGKGKIYYFSPGGDAWEDKGSFNYGSYLEADNNPLIWGSSDVLNEDETVYLAASDPIPLDGMTVIEWDGDTTGLLEYDASLLGIPVSYKMSDYVEVETAVHAITYNGEALVIPSDCFSKEETGWTIQYEDTIYVFGAIGNNDSQYDGIWIAPALSGLEGVSYLLAYTPTTTDEPEEEEPEPTTPTLDPLSILMGYQAGEILKAWRGKKTPVAYLYNGVRLPKLPEWDKTVYPYAFIRTITSGTDYNELYVFKSKPTWFKPNLVTTVYGVEDGNPYLKAIDYPTGSDEDWGYVTLSEKTSGGYLSSGNFDGIYWANYDVLSQDGTVYLAASEPIPVYE